MLKYVLQIKNDDMLKQSNITSKIHPYIDKTKKPRLIEAPQAELKIVQRRIKTLLGKIQTPDNVFSGIKGKSYPENARMHIGGRKRNLYKTDLTAFFPSISREDVYQFFITNCVVLQGCFRSADQFNKQLALKDFQKKNSQKSMTF